MLLAGSLSAHMAQHILIMSAVAPALAYGMSRHGVRPGAGALATATVVQIALLWAWHAPPLLPLLHVLPVHLLMLVTLLIAATWFWLAVVDSVKDGTHAWRPVVALLVTSKLFCLLGVLFIFAPRPLFVGAMDHAVADLLADQQLAGLLMIVACPLTYLLAGILCAIRWFASLERASYPPVPG
jgi:putative membrane protein